MMEAAVPGAQFDGTFRAQVVSHGLLLNFLPLLFVDPAVFVCSGQHPQAAILDRRRIEGGPAGDHAICGVDVEPKWLILVVGLSRADPRWLHEQLVLIELEVRAK